MLNMNKQPQESKRFMWFSPPGPSRPQIDWAHLSGITIVAAYILTTIACIGSLALLCLLLPFGLSDAQVEDFVVAHVFTYGVYCVVGAFHVVWGFLTGGELPVPFE